MFVVYCELVLAGWDSVDSEFEWSWRGIVQNCISHLRLYCIPSEMRLIEIHTVWHDPSRESGRDTVPSFDDADVIRMMKNRTYNKVLPKNDVFTVRVSSWNLEQGR